MKNSILLNQRSLVKRHKANDHILKIYKNKKKALLLADMLKQINIFEHRIELMKIEIK